MVEITKNGKIFSIINTSNYYNVDVLVIVKHIEIYGKYPPILLLESDIKKYYNQHLKDIERVLKINKIIKRYGIH